MQNVTYVAISLRGSAATLLTNLPQEQCGDFDVLSSDLKNIYGKNHPAEPNRAHLRSQTRKSDETLPELAERLTRLAYPELENWRRFGALPDYDVRLRIEQNCLPTQDI